ncbi:MAG: nucleotide exchange factor GrpE [Oscillospiraceae bacterium]
MSSTKKPPKKADEPIEEAGSVNEKETATVIEEVPNEELKKALDDLAAEKDKCLRVMAEYDNFRKRSQKERENIYTDVRADTISRLLPVYDNLERALKQETADEAYARGVEMIMTQLVEVFSKMGVSEIPAAQGVGFDPLVHNAVMHVEDESQGESVIMEEFQKGFKLGDKVIRVSTVKVAN